MPYRPSDLICCGCGATADERQRLRPDMPQGLSVCPYCDAEKCAVCDMGDDVECGNCPDDADDAR